MKKKYIVSLEFDSDFIGESPEEVLEAAKRRLAEGMYSMSIVDEEELEEKERRYMNL